MKNGNKITHPVIIIWFAIIILLILSSQKLPVIPYLNNYSSIDILNDIRPDKTTVVAAANKNKSQPVVDASAAPVQKAPVIDSSLITDYAIDTGVTMRSFYKKLNALKTAKGKVRIAYFGDSFIEGDFITGQLRQKLQQIYGGNGVGFVPMQSVVAEDYQTLRFDDNTSWADYNFRSNPNKYPLGLPGHIFYSKGNSWSQYKALNKQFKNIYLFTGKTATAAKVAVEEDGTPAEIALADDNFINRTALNNGTPVSKLKITSTETGLPVYGISIEDSTGVYIDNYGFRGNTGALTLQLQPDVLKGFNSYFNYDLIILHYGLNVVTHNDTNYLWFDRCMAKLIQNIRSNFPGVPVLIVSTSDIAYNNGGKYITDPAAPALVRVQDNIARKNKTAFWNLYYSMGGENSIANWVEGDTTYAYKDYLHVNPKGAEKIAGIFLDKLLHSQNN